jgi:hypothetical protein
MTEIDRTEAALLADLATLGERLADEEFCTELYHALAGGRLMKVGGAIAPVSDSHEWEHTAHEEADRSRFRRPGAPAQELPGMGAGGGKAPRIGGS